MHHKHHPPFQIYDQKTGQTNLLTNQTVTMYVCGPTLYNYIHLGNARAMLIFDILQRSLTYLNYKVTYLQCLTDIDDKIIAVAQQQATTEKSISNFYKKQYVADLTSLHINIPNLIKVSDNIKPMIKFIKQMLMKKYAYLNNDGIYFDLSKVDQPYGALSNRSLPTIANEAHVNKQIADFALWKNTKTGKTWFNKLTKQRGRPGWHTECALFIKQFFKNQPIDIHGGGIDLLFPHHENERIQLMATNHLQEPVANWMYVGMLTNNHTKMSKSIGNIIFVKDFVAETGCNSFRYLVMQSDYHKPLNFSNQLLQNAQIKIKQWQSLILTTYIWICGESKTKTFNNQPDLNYINQFKATISQNLDSNKVCFLLDALKDDIMKAININHQTTINLFEAFLEIIITLGFKVNKPTMWQFYNIKTKIKCWISWQQQKDFVRADLKLNELKKTITTILNN